MMSDDSMGTGAVLALWNDVAAELESEYNEWHANEHVPERLTVPGMNWGLRYRRKEGGVGPRYLTLYGMESADVVNGAAYRLLLSRPTPTSARMRPHLRNLSRWVCEVHEMREFGHPMGLAVWTLESDLEARSIALDCRTRGDGLLLGRRSREAQPLPWVKTDQTHAIEGNWILAVALRSEMTAPAGMGSRSLMYEAL